MTMASPTPLVILARLLAERRGEEPPAFGEREAEEVRDALRRLARTRREREVAEYLIRAAAGERATRGRAPGTRAGSLKHLLWWLRDYGGAQYEDAARALLERVLDDPNLPLHEGLAARLLHDDRLGPWAQQALAGASREELAALMEWEEIGPFRVAFNPTEKNLTKAAMEGGADLYVAASAAGAALKARWEKGQPQAIPPKALGAICERAGGKWAAPYPDLRVCREGAPTLEALRAAVREVLAALGKGEAP
jgi:hypothetical protein